MKYVVTTNETHNVTTEYLVEADSGDEASTKFRNEGQIVDEIFNFVENEEIVEIQPFVE